jgi:ABC-type uncharacterized transport system substrate-binding protein
VGVVLPANEVPALPLNPGEETLDEPALSRQCHRREQLRRRAGRKATGAIARASPQSRAHRTDGQSDQGVTKDVTAAASAIGVDIDVVRASDSREIEVAFATLVRNRADALVVGADSFLTSRRLQLATLATRHAIPAVYNGREFAEAGGLMGYSTSVTEVYRQLGDYTGRILKGAKPADLPVVQSTKFEFVINLPTARALGLDVPPMLLARADEVIE